MNDKEATEFIINANKFGSVYGLKSVQELLKRLENPQNELKFIHIAGTNGKGSTLAFLQSILMDSDYRVGRYSSPFLVDYREVIQVNGEWIKQSSLTRLLNKIKEAVDQMIKEGLSHPTRFEMEAALAFLYFKEENCDVVLLETGLGGLLDATNCVETTLISIIASISKDHMLILGDTLEEIAYQKAGIIKENKVVVTFDQDKEILDVIKKVAKEKKTKLNVAIRKNIDLVETTILKTIFHYLSNNGECYQNLEISLIGKHQLDNAVLAIETIHQLRDLGYSIKKDSIYNGLINTHWFGRFELIHEDPIIILDGAHNQDASLRLRENLKTYFKDRKLIYIMGIFKDKDYTALIENTYDLSDCIITINNPENERLFTSKELKEIVIQYHQNVIESKSIEDAYKKAIHIADKNSVIICFGSLSFLGEINKLVKGGNRNDR